MYKSLKSNFSGEFIFWILCMDDLTFEVLDKMNLKNIRLIKLKDFENEDLLRVKKDRSVAEYSWTCASNFIYFLFEKYGSEIEIMTYLDADLYFFKDPIILIDEMGENDVLITEHRYSKQYDQSSISGKYCVQFMVFKNNKNSLLILEKWKNDCIDWCFNKIEKDRFGDQKYLDNWTKIFNGVHELKNLGGGVAPWNVQRYRFIKKDKDVFLIDGSREWPLIFYHFHSFCLISEYSYSGARRYKISKDVENLINKEYFNALRRSVEDVRFLNSDFYYGFKKITIKESVISFIARIDLIIRIKNKIYAKKYKS